MYNAIVIGAGSIGALKDDKYDSKETETILTLAHAFWVDERINLIGIVDKNKEKALIAARKWDTAGYININQIDKNIDIVAVCVDTDQHYTVLMEVLKKKPQLVIAEKPFCCNSREAELVIKIYEKARIPIMIDFIRRYNSIFQNIAHAIRSKTYGKIRHASHIYTRGLMHEACHSIDIFRLFFGNFIDGEIVYPDFGFADRDKKDKTHAVVMQFELCPYCVFLPFDGRDYGIYEFDILTQKSRVRIVESSSQVKICYPEKEKVYGSYNSLYDDNPRIYKTHLKKSLLNVVGNAIGHLKNNETLVCIANDALKVHEILEYLTIY
jgi:predicted dehydrogenase